MLGLRGHGRLGNGGTSDKYAPTLTSSLEQDERPSVFQQVRLTPARLDNGEVACWGEGSNGQLGEGTGSDSTTPIATAVFGPNQAAESPLAGHTPALWMPRAMFRAGDSVKTDAWATVGTALNPRQPSSTILVQVRRHLTSLLVLLTHAVR